MQEYSLFSLFPPFSSPNPTFQISLHFLFQPCILYLRTNISQSCCCSSSIKGTNGGKLLLLWYLDQCLSQGHGVLDSTACNHSLRTMSCHRIGAEWMLKSLCTFLQMHCQSTYHCHAVKINILYPPFQFPTL